MTWIGPRTSCSLASRDAGRRASERQELLASPVVAIGNLEQVCDKLCRTHDRFGFNYFVASVGSRPAVLAPVIERLSGI